MTAAATLRLRLLLPFVAALGVGALSLDNGFALDDWIHRAILHRAVPWGDPGELYTFATGEPEALRPFIRTGPFPWFTLPELKIRFLRPLASALHRVDAGLLGGSALAAHLHSVAWSLALVGLALALYRRLLPQLWWLAALLFAIDDSHALPVMWVANRNGLVATTFALGALWAHLRWRVDGKGSFAPLSVLLAGLGLASAEMGVGALAFIVAREVFTPGLPARERLKGLAPLALLMACYVVAYRLNGAGVYGSATYVDPLRSPLEWLSTAPGRGLAMLGSWSVALLASDLWLAAPAVRPLLVVEGIVAAGLWGVLWRRFRWERRPDAVALRWLVPGAVGAVLPALSTFPSERLLMAASFGLCALVAVVLRAALEAGRGWPRLVVAWGAVVFVAQPLLSWVAVDYLVTSWSRLGEAGIADSPTAGTGRVVLVTSSDFLPAIYGTAILAEQGRPLPSTWQTLSMAPAAHRLVRLDERSFELTVVGARMVDSVFEQNFRDEGHPLEVGHRVELDGLSITVTASTQGHPTAIRVELALPPAAYQFVTWDGARLAPYELPGLGAPPAELPRARTIPEVALGLTPR